MDAARLLELIEENVAAHGADLDGWTRRDDAALQLFAGRVTLRVELLPDGPAPAGSRAHAHILTTLHEYDDAVLEACVLGLGADEAAALAQVALIWTRCVAAPIKSFIDDRPVGPAYQAGVAEGDRAAGYAPGDFGLPGARAYVGPAVARGFNDQELVTALDDTRPWFRFALESAAPRRVHLAKATVLARGPAGWDRELEIDGHDISHPDPNWPAGLVGPAAGYLTRYAVFEIAPDSPALARRADLDRAIRYFAENYARHEKVDHLMSAMVRQGFDPDVVYAVESVATIAFGRALFAPTGIHYAATFIRAGQDGQVETDVPLLSLPAYARARALAPQLRATMPPADFQALCLYHAESQAILRAIEAGADSADLSHLQAFPPIVPDRLASDETVDAAVAALQAQIEAARGKGQGFATGHSERSEESP